MDDIRYIKHAEINKEMWDACITNSPNGLIYSRSWFLDAMTPNWDALVHKDYIAVMPLTISRKVGVSYLSQPAFCQQTGITGPIDFNEKITQTFIDIACSKFPLVEINLNFKNEYPKGSMKCNLILDLLKPFETIQAAFRKDLISKSVFANLQIEKSVNYKSVIDSFKKLYLDKIPHLKEKDFNNFLKVCKHVSKTGNLFVRKVLNQDGKLLSDALFFKDEKRIYYMLSATFPEGKKCDANAYLLYQVIKEFSGSNYIFDFEGSSIPSIKFFFKKFNPVEENYPIVRINNLSPFIKKIKSILSK
jgi:hypothetical protein